jgi:two-component system, NtrC family, response regulator AtoC
MTSDAVLSFPGPAQVDADRMDHIQPASGIAALAPTVLPDCHLEELDGGGFFLAYTPAMQKIRNELRLVADLNIPLLILGESGTGKEIVARLVHQYSKRRHAPFMKVNCAAIPSELLESELFGFETGAFTGAKCAKPGKF